MSNCGYIQLEEGVCDLQHQYVGVIVLVADEDAFTGSTHAMFLVMFLQSLQTRKHRRIFLWLAIFRPECVVAEGIQPYRLWLVRVEVFGEGRPVQVLV
jgi:hypothetical protein